MKDKSTDYMAVKKKLDYVRSCVHHAHKKAEDVRFSRLELNLLAHDIDMVRRALAVLSETIQ